jgi:hypothetical protein
MLIIKDLHGVSIPLPPGNQKLGTRNSPLKRRYPTDAGTSGRRRLWSAAVLCRFSDRSGSAQRQSSDGIRRGPPVADEACLAKAPSRRRITRRTIQDRSGVSVSGECRQFSRPWPNYPTERDEAWPCTYPSETFYRNPEHRTGRASDIIRHEPTHHGTPTTYVHTLFGVPAFFSHTAWELVISISTHFLRLSFQQKTENLTLRTRACARYVKDRTEYTTFPKILGRLPP